MTFTSRSMPRTCYLQVSEGIYKSYDNLVKFCPFYRWNLSGCDFTRVIFAVTQWVLNGGFWLPSFLEFFFFLNHRKVGGGWNEKVQCWSTKSHQQQPSTSRGLNHLFLFIIVFQKHTCRGNQLEFGLLSVLVMGAWVRWNQAYRDQEREVNLEAGRSGIFPCPNPTVWGLPSFKCGLKDKGDVGRRRLYGIGAVIKSGWLQVVYASFMVNGWEKQLNYSKRNPVLH